MTRRRACFDHGPRVHFDLEPLADAMGIRLLGPTDPTGNQWMPDHSVGVRELGERLGVPLRTLTRWRADGIPEFGVWPRDPDSEEPRRWVDLPDTLACLGAGLHPALIWPEWLDDEETDDIETEVAA